MIENQTLAPDNPINTLPLAKIKFSLPMGDLKMLVDYLPYLHCPEPADSEKHAIYQDTMGQLALKMSQRTYSAGATPRLTVTTAQAHCLAQALSHNISAIENDYAQHCFFNLRNELDKLLTNAK